MGFNFLLKIFKFYECTRLRLGRVLAVSFFFLFLDILRYGSFCFK